MPGLTIQLTATIAALSFLFEYMDSTLGMGYGTAMAPVLMLFGFTPLQIVPAILLSELITCLSAGLLHHRAGNVDFRFEFPRFALPGRAARGRASAHLKVVGLLLSAAVVGATSAVFAARALPVRWTSLYISVMVIAMGVLILACFNRKFGYSWKRIGGIGLLASFNKALTGGGYGPIVVSGQVLSGVEGKNAVGITSLAKSATGALGVAAYYFTSKSAMDWRLAPVIAAGAFCAVPFGVGSVKKVKPELLKGSIAVLTIILGTCALIKTLRTF